MEDTDEWDFGLELLMNLYIDESHTVLNVMNIDQIPITLYTFKNKG